MIEELIKKMEYKIDSDDFEIIPSDTKSVQWPNKNTSWHIKTKENLSAGTHTGIITVSYNDGKTSTAKATVEISKVPSSVTKPPTGKGKSFSKSGFRRELPYYENGFSHPFCR